jgi:glycosyltransferase involved in cell wall biosynthesis
MHYVFISTLFDPPWGGSENLWSSTALRALDAGHDVSVFVSERSALEDPLVKLKAAGARLHFWKPQYAPLNLLQRVMKKVSGRRLPQWEWWHQNIPRDADAICVSQGGMFCAFKFHGLVEAVAATRRPYLLLARCDAGIEMLNENTRPQVRSFVEKASAFVAASRSTVDLVKLYLPSAMSNALVLHSPIRDCSQDLADYTNTDLVHFACVGRLQVADKGQNLLLASLASEPWKSRPFKLTFYGDGPDKKYLQEVTEFFGLQDKVEFAGHVSDVADVWRKTHLAIQPSFAEGAPQSLLEAMLCRRPCVATAVSGIPEWVEDGKTGFLAAAPTVRHLSDALERAWVKRDRWKEMGEAARELCLVKRDPDPAGTLFALLREAAERGTKLKR